MISGASATIMIVDDTPANLKLLDGMLRERGYRVMAFPRGDLALKAAAKQPPDLILLDIMMPRMNGYEVCRALKADDALKDIPVIFMSALGETEDKITAFSAGGVDYVTKPLRFEEVYARVKTHLELQARTRELESAYKQLCKLEAMRDNLVHMIVHDMRSPLMAISGFLELAQVELEEMDVPSEPLAGHLKSALGSTRMLIEMVSTILDVSKIESGNMVLERTPVDLGRLAHEVLREMKSLIGERKVECSLPEGPPTVLCDHHLIRRVMRNIIDNAVKCTDEKGGEIGISIAAEEDHARVVISDNGPGIDDKERDQIFAKFKQLQTRKRGGHTTGLGLTFCKMAVEAHGGRIGVDGKPGEGSRFWFELPVGER